MSSLWNFEPKLSDCLGQNVKILTRPYVKFQNILTSDSLWWPPSLNNDVASGKSQNSVVLFWEEIFKSIFLDKDAWTFKKL